MQLPRSVVASDVRREPYERSLLMKIARVTCCLFVLLLSLVAFAFITSAPRAHAASGTTFVFRFHGSSAFAFFDNLSGCIDTSVSVDLTWTSTSAIAHEISSFHFHTKGFTENAHFNADFRDANASGTVSAGTTNFTPSQSVFAQIFSAKEVDVMITRP